LPFAAFTSPGGMVAQASPQEPRPSPPSARLDRDVTATVYAPPPSLEPVLPFAQPGAPPAARTPPIETGPAPSARFPEPQELEDAVYRRDAPSPGLPPEPPMIGPLAKYPSSTEPTPGFEPASAAPKIDPPKATPAAPLSLCT